jgi:hypothetical protein
MPESIPGKAPNSKLQAPEKLQHQTSKEITNGHESAQGIKVRLGFW